MPRWTRQYAGLYAERRRQRRQRAHAQVQRPAPSLFANAARLLDAKLSRTMVDDELVWDRSRHIDVLLLDTSGRRALQTALVAVAGAARLSGRRVPGSVRTQPTLRPADTVGMLNRSRIERMPQRKDLRAIFDGPAHRSGFMLVRSAKLPAAGR